MLSYASNNDFLCRTSAGDLLTVKVFSSKARTANLTIRASSSYFKENPPKEVIETKMNEIVDISVNDGQPIDLTNKVLPGKKAESPLHLADQGIQDLRTHNVKTDDKKGFFGDVFN